MINDFNVGRSYVNEINSLYKQFLVNIFKHYFFEYFNIIYNFFSKLMHLDRNINLVYKFNEQDFTGRIFFFQ